MTHHIAIVVFYNTKGEILMQNRTGHSKAGEKYGFYGGGVQNNESPSQALKRELHEELGFVPAKIKYWGTNNFSFTQPGKYHNWKIIQHVYLAPITDRLLQTKPKEGAGHAISDFLSTLNNPELDSHDRKLLAKIQKDLATPIKSRP